MRANKSPEGFAARVRNALAWRWGSQLIAQFKTWGSTILVVRLLDPSDCNLFAMSQVVVTALSFLNGWSFASSLIQSDEVSERDIGQVFALLLVTNGVLAAIQLLLAPLVAQHYGQPEVARLLQVQALIFLAIPFTALPTAPLRHGASSSAARALPISFRRAIRSGYRTGARVVCRGRLDR